MKLLIFSVLLGVVRGDSFGPMNIVGGTDAVENVFPHLVTLQYLKSSHFCGGSLVKAGTGEIVVVTAAHCVIGESASGIQVEVGEHKLNVDDEAYERVYPVKKIVMHPGYDNNIVTNDIAILFLAEKVEENPGVKAISLTDKPTVNWFNKKCTITGWGTTSEGGPGAETLQTAEVFTFPDSKCYEDYGLQYLKRTMMCGGLEEGGIDACQGDSGGPYICRDDSKGEFVLNGVVSWGSGCARPGAAGVYTDVYMMRGWLNARLGL